MTATEFDTQAAAAIDALANMGARLPVSDLLLTADLLAAGATRFQLSVELVAADEQDSNVVRDAADALITVHHRLDVAESELAYRTGILLTHQAAILRSSFWRALASVYGVLEGPELDASVEREGRVVSYSIKVRCALN